MVNKEALSGEASKASEVLCDQQPPKVVIPCHSLHVGLHGSAKVEIRFVQQAAPFPSFQATVQRILVRPPDNAHEAGLEDDLREEGGRHGKAHHGERQAAPVTHRLLPEEHTEELPYREEFYGH